MSEFETKECSDCNGARGYYSYTQQCVFPCDTCCGYGYEEDYSRPINKGKKSMNYSSAVMLINSNIRAIKTTYEKDTEKNKQQRYIFKTLDNTIKKGDFVVIPTNTRHNMTVVLVDEVDVDVDFESDIELQWVIDKVNPDNYSNVILEEAKWIEALKASEKRRKREEIKKNMLEMYADDNIEKLPIANMKDAKEPPSIEHAE